MDFEDWLEELLELAETEGQAQQIRRTQNLYEEYFDDNMSPEQAWVAEWGM